MRIYMGGCQNYGPFLGTLNIRGRIIMGIQKGTIILTTTHMYIYIYLYIYIHTSIMKIWVQNFGLGAQDCKSRGTLRKPKDGT